MKSYATAFTILAVMLVCMLGQQQQASASFFGRLGRDFKDVGDDVAHAAVKAADDTAHVADEGAKDVATGVSDGADDVAKAASTAAKATAQGVSDGAKAVGKAVANSGPVIQKVDKVANEIEPVAKVVATGLEIGSTIGELAAA